MKAREDAVYSLTPAEDHTGKEGYFVEINGSDEAAIVNAATDVPFGVISEGEDVTGKSAVATPGSMGAYRVKLGATPGAVIRGSYLTVNADGTCNLDDGAGARVRVARAMESGAADELVEAYLLDPIVLT